MAFKAFSLRGLHLLRELGVDEEDRGLELSVGSLDRLVSSISITDLERSHIRADRKDGVLDSSLLLQDGLGNVSFEYLLLDKDGSVVSLAHGVGEVRLTTLDIAVIDGVRVLPFEGNRSTDRVTAVEAVTVGVLTIVHKFLKGLGIDSDGGADDQGE